MRNISYFKSHVLIKYRFIFDKISIWIFFHFPKTTTMYKSVNNAVFQLEGENSRRPNGLSVRLESQGKLVRFPVETYILIVSHSLQLSGDLAYEIKA